MTKSYDDAEDITQTVFINAYENLGSYDANYKFFSWIYRSAVNHSLNLLNHRNRKEELKKNVNIKDKSYEEILDSIELSNKIQDSLEELDINYRLVIVLKHFLNFSYTEMAELLEVPEKTVKSRLYSARQIMKDILIKNKVV